MPSVRVQNGIAYAGTDTIGAPAGAQADNPANPAIHQTRMAHHAPKR